MLVRVFPLILLEGIAIPFLPQLQLGYDACVGPRLLDNNNHKFRNMFKRRTVFLQMHQPKTRGEATPNL